MDHRSIFLKTYTIYDHQCWEMYYFYLILYKKYDYVTTNSNNNNNKKVKEIAQLERSHTGDFTFLQPTIDAAAFQLDIVTHV